MPDVQDITLALKNLQIEYKQSLIVTFEGHYFFANPETILWIERQLITPERNQNRSYDIHGFPCDVFDLRGLLAELRERLRQSDIRYVESNKELMSEFAQSFSVVSGEPEDEE